MKVNCHNGDDDGDDNSNVTISLKGLWEIILWDFKFSHDKLKFLFLLHHLVKSNVTPVYFTEQYLENKYKFLHSKVGNVLYIKQVKRFWKVFVFFFFIS